MFCCSNNSMKVYCGVVVLSMVTSSWVSATQFLKATYHIPRNVNISTDDNNQITFSAPFLTCWFCMVWTILFFPLHLLSITMHSCWNKRSNNTSQVLQDALYKFREVGIKPGVLLSRCFLFCLLSVTTNYLYIASLR